MNVLSRYKNARPTLDEAINKMLSKLFNGFKKLLSNEDGGEVLEYALIAGLIVVAAIGVIGAVGTKVVARWTSLNHSM
jgi:Flp pilus assembly pilin Flp